MQLFRLHSRFLPQEQIAGTVLFVCLGLIGPLNACSTDQPESHGSDSSSGGVGGSGSGGAAGGGLALGGSVGGENGASEGTGGERGFTQPTKLQVFVLSGQSNMEGFGFIPMTQTEIDKNGGLGTLTYLVQQDPGTFGHLGTPDRWTERDDVWIARFTEANGDPVVVRQGPLTVNYGAFDGRFGPELQFGHVVGNFFDAPVLLIKAAWGGKSLAVDFRPPSSGGEVGLYYTKLVDRVHHVLDDLETYMPSYDGRGYDLAGFVWVQGWNDRPTANANEYQFNCVNLINDLRAEFDEPELPFVLSTTGNHGWTEMDSAKNAGLTLINAQLAVPDDPRLTAGFVEAVETRGFARTFEESPRGQDYHWYQNAESYVLIGNGLGEAMVDLHLSRP